jgi:hypothetical protein
MEKQKGKTMKIKILFIVLFVALGILCTGTGANAQGPNPTASKSKAPSTNAGTAFTYQGQIKQSGTLYTGTCSMQFGLYDALLGGTQIGATQTVNGVSVASGLFTTPIDFGANAFDGNKRFLQIAVKCGSDSTYTTLAPLQELTPAPYALSATNFSGSLAGDVTGTQNSTTVTKLQNRTVASTAPTTGQVLKYDGTQWTPGTDNTSSYQNVIIVAKSGGNFTTISAALASITTNSATNRYLVWVAPGIYNEKVIMKQYVDIEGAGETATKITSAGSSGITGTVKGADNSELRHLTVENLGSNTYAIAIFNDGASPRLTHLTIHATGASYSSRGIDNYYASSPTIKDVTITASGGINCYGINSDTAAPIMTNVIVTVSGATSNYGIVNTSQGTSAAVMTNVTVTASGGTNNYGVHNDTSSPKMSLVVVTALGGTHNIGIENIQSASPTMMNVTVTSSGGTGSNWGVHNDASSPIMIQVSATGSGGTNSFGVLNSNLASATMTNVIAKGISGSSENAGVYSQSSSPTMTNVTATSVGGNRSYGVYFQSANPATLINVTATASGGVNNYAVFNDQSSANIQNSTLRASGGSSSYGLYNNATSGTYKVYVNNSQVSGGTNSIKNAAQFTTRIGASLMDGASTGTSPTCAGVYDTNYTFYASTCP